MLKRWIWIVATLFALSLVPANALAQRGSRGGGSRASTPRAARPAQRRQPLLQRLGKIVPRLLPRTCKTERYLQERARLQPKGGTYKNDNTQDRYQKQPNKQP